MIQINLLPGANKKTASRQGIDLSAFRADFGGMFKDRFLIGATSAVVLTLGAVGYLYTSQTAKVADLESHRDHAVAAQGEAIREPAAARADVQEI